VSFIGFLEECGCERGSRAASEPVHLVCAWGSRAGYKTGRTTVSADQVMCC
jgi:hypothetical protein